MTEVSVETCFLNSKVLSFSLNNLIDPINESFNETDFVRVQAR